MAAHDKNPVRHRCPVCFGRETDVVLCQAGRNYYCVKCSFRGTREDVLSMYADIQKKFRWMLTRITMEEQRDKL